MHVHSWLIDSPAGDSYSEGVCDCGETRLFPNSIDAAIAANTEETSRFTLTNNNRMERAKQIDIDEVDILRDSSKKKEVSNEEALNQLRKNF